MDVYNVALAVAGTWYPVTIPQGVSNLSITSSHGNDIRMRRQGQTNIVTIDVSAGPLQILGRHMREEVILEFSCPGAANEVAEIVVW